MAVPLKGSQAPKDHVCLELRLFNLVDYDVLFVVLPTAILRTHRIEMIDDTLN